MYSKEPEKNEEKYKMVKKIMDEARYVVSQHMKKEFDSLISLEKVDKNWVAIVEVLERKFVPSTQDLLSRYEIKFDQNGVLESWKQTIVRKRSDKYPIDEDE